MLFTLSAGGAAWDDSSIVVQDLSTGERKVLLKGGTDARVLPTGHLVYTSAATMLAVPFDEKRLMVTGAPVAVQQGIQPSPATGVAQVAWSAAGTFVIVHGTEFFSAAPVWVNRQGQQERTKLPIRNYGIGSSELRLSPDGTRVAVSIYGDDVLRFERAEASEVYVGESRPRHA